MVDAFMNEEPGKLVRIIILDGEACNGFIRKAIHGTLGRSERRRIQQLSWFSRVQHEELPGVDSWLRFPMFSCKVDSEYIFALSGPAHAQKNALAQCLSPIRTVFCGNLWCDMAGTLECSIPLPAFMQLDPMSDRLAALACCPLFMVDPKADKIVIPWHSRGLLVWSSSCAMCLASWIMIYL